MFSHFTSQSYFVSALSTTQYDGLHNTSIDWIKRIPIHLNPHCFGIMRHTQASGANYQCRCRLLGTVVMRCLTVLLPSSQQFVYRRLTMNISGLIVAKQRGVSFVQGVWYPVFLRCKLQRFWWSWKSVRRQKPHEASGRVGTISGTIPFATPHPPTHPPHPPPPPHPPTPPPPPPPTPPPHPHPPPHPPTPPPRDMDIKSNRHRFHMIAKWWYYTFSPVGTGTLEKRKLTHWGRDKLDAISQTTFSNAFSWMKLFEYQLKFHWSLFLRAQLTIPQHWLR